MAYFPAYIQLENKNILIIGGGRIAYEKLKHLLDFSQNITIIAKNYNKKLQRLANQHNLKVFTRAYQNDDIKGYDIVIIAVDDISLQERIYNQTRDTRVLCNAVDSVKFCDFIFPSYIKQGDLIISVSTSGTSPSVAKYLRRHIQNLIPEDLNIFLDRMKTLRVSLPKGKKRMKLLDKKAKKYFKE